MRGDEAAIAVLKTELFGQIEALEPQFALFPSKEASINEIVQQLESMNPTPCPFQSTDLPSLLGDWQLVYASNGTVVTREVASMTQNFGRVIKIIKVWQSLAASGNGKITAENNALLALPLLGEWQLSAGGVWEGKVDEQVAQVSFSAFSLGATKLFGLSGWRLPQLTIPVLEFLRNEALWITSYLDREMRIGRGATGNLFVFRRLDSKDVEAT